MILTQLILQQKVAIIEIVKLISGWEPYYEMQLGLGYIQTKNLIELTWYWIIK